MSFGLTTLDDPLTDEEYAARLERLKEIVRERFPEFVWSKG